MVMSVFPAAVPKFYGSLRLERSEHIIVPRTLTVKEIKEYVFVSNCSVDLVTRPGS